MKRTKHIISITAFLLPLLVCGHSFAQAKIVVDKKGGGNFTSIQAAISSLTDSSNTSRLIFIKNGTYDEKIMISKCKVILEGESRDSVIIKQSIARDEWRCDHRDDWGVATMNINADDITLENLTIENTYGFENKTARIVSCTADTITHQKKIPFNGHQMALRTIDNTRMKAINVHFKSYAGDTVSPWNVKSGMFYFKDCIMEGGVDFYCPRGWAYAEDCRFYANTGPASIWHDGSGNEDEKSVFKNCSFDGYKNFDLGRYHKDAQFYLVNCLFSKNMADRDIYLVPTSNKIKWGRRVYYYDCHRTGGDFTWFKNNLSSAKEAPSSKEINPFWVFGNRWNPLKSEEITN
ncbi:MAG: pectinesterase family protein [Ginsengibacter sp.]